MKNYFFKLLLSAAILCILNSSFLITNSSAQWVKTSGPTGGIITSFTTSGTNYFAGSQYGVFLFQQITDKTGHRLHYHTFMI